MKKLIFATVMMLVMALASYGNPNERNAKLIGSLSNALKDAKATSTIYSENFKKISFDFIGKSVSAFYDAQNDELVGFSIPLSAADLPAGAMENIKRKYSKYEVAETIMFIYKNGYFGFYVSLKRDKKPTIVIDVNSKGKAHYYTKM